jgi:hypothetical protein
VTLAQRGVRVAGSRVQWQDGWGGKAEDPLGVAVQEQLGGFPVELKTGEVAQAVGRWPGRMVRAEQHGGATSPPDDRAANTRSNWYLTDRS